MATSANRNLNLLYPPFRERLEMGLRLCHYQGLFVHVFEGWRSPERQSYLYAKGRSTEGKIVTHARPGFSYHGYGLAADLVFDSNPDTLTKDWTWEGDYQKVAAILETLGIETLKFERAHFQMSFGLDIKAVKHYSDTKGNLALWNYLDEKTAQSNG